MDALVFATKEDYGKYTGQDETTLPGNIDILLKRASEKIYAIVYRNYNENIVLHKQAVEMATCAQVQYWIECNEGSAIEDNSNIAGYSFGGISVSYNTTLQNKDPLCSMAMLYLRQAGLLYKGVK